jgi:peptidoglycan/xylan/chitin deacetylase (PgdA/CDA1 family)
MSSTTRRAVQRASLVTLLFVAVACSESERAAPPASTSTTHATTTSTTVSPATSGPIVVPTTATTATTGTTTTATPTTVAPIAPAAIVRRGDAHLRWAALTFDAGSDTGNTAVILDLLASRHVHASFSLTGDFAKANAPLVRRIRREGHLIVNHTDGHRSFTGVSTHTAPLSAAERVRELRRADVAIAGIAGTTTRPWFRPPYGDIDEATPVDAARAGYRYVLLWTVDSLGWKGLSPATVAARCLNGAQPGAILLLHVGSQSTDSAALPAIIDGLRGRGYDLVTVAEPGFVAG